MKEKAFHEKMFGLSLAAAGPAMLAEHGRERGHAFLAAARAEFARLLPDLPPHRTLLARVNFTAAPTALAFHRAVSPHMPGDRALAAAHGFMAAAIPGVFASQVPAFLLRLMGAPALCAPVLGLLLRRDNLADDPEGWIFRVLPRRKGHIADFDVTRCGVHRYFEKNGVPELTSRTICPLDDWFCARVFPPGSRLERETLLSRGDACCAFRFLGPGA